MDCLASNYEILVKTEPFLKFKKELFRELFENSKLDEEILRRKFYKFIDFYLHKKSIEGENFDGLDVDFLTERMDAKFKKMNEGSFVVRGHSIGYLKNDGEVQWVRYSEGYVDGEIKTYL